MPDLREKKLSLDLSNSCLDSKVRILGSVINDIDLNLENFYTYSRRGYGYGYYSKQGQGTSYEDGDEDAK